MQIISRSMWHCSVTLFVTPCHDILSLTISRSLLDLKANVLQRTER